VKSNANITLFNKYVSDRSEFYISTQIERVTWEDRKAVNKLSSGGDIKADAAYIYIPKARGLDYLTPKLWLENKTSNWTLQSGDIVVRGLIEDEITSAFTISDLKKKYDFVLTINSVDLYDNASLVVAHWKIAAS